MHGRLLRPDRVEVEVLATGVDRARLVLTPTGTAAAYYSKVVAETTPRRTACGSSGIRSTGRSAP